MISSTMICHQEHQHDKIIAQHLIHAGKGKSTFTHTAAIHKGWHRGAQLQMSSSAATEMGIHSLLLFCIKMTCTKPFPPDLAFSHTAQTGQKKHQVSPFQGQEMDENSTLGERNRWSCLNMILPSSALGIRTSAGFRTPGLAPGSWHNPNQKWHVLFQVKMSLAWTRAWASCSCWKLKPATVLLHFPGCSEVSFWFSLSKSGLKENKTNKSPQELVYSPPSKAKEQRHKPFSLRNPY